METVTSLYIYIIYISKHISLTLIPYHLTFLLHVNLFLFHVLCLWHLLYLYFFCIPISSTLHIPILIMCSSFSLLSYVFFNAPVLFQVTHHVSSICLFHLSVI